MAIDFGLAHQPRAVAGNQRRQIDRPHGLIGILRQRPALEIGARPIQPQAETAFALEIVELDRQAARP